MSNLPVPPPPTSLRSQASNKSGSRSSTAPTHVVLTEIMLESTTSDTCGARSSFCYAVPCCAAAKSASRVSQSIRQGLEHDHHSLHPNYNKKGSNRNPRHWNLVNVVACAKKFDYRLHAWTSQSRNVRNHKMPGLRTRILPSECQATGSLAKHGAMVLRRPGYERKAIQPGPSTRRNQPVSKNGG